MATSEQWWLANVAIALFFKLIDASSSCSNICECDRYTPSRMTCNNIQFTSQDLLRLKIPTSVTELRMYSNGISEISGDLLRNFVNLTSLEISQNSFSTIPPNTFAKFKNLKTLKLKRNKLDSINRNSFAGLGNLRKLDLGNNDIKVLTPTVFHELRSIQEIKLIYNKIQTIPNGLFTSLPNIRDLFLTKNNISTIEDRAFQNLTMKRIALTHNKLKRIPTSALKGLKITLKILLYFNPLECLCRDLMDYSTNLKHLKNRILGDCESPYEVKDKHMMSAYEETSCTQCDLNPCRNGGKCTGNKTWYTCVCTERFKGKNCETSICPAYQVKYVERVVYVPRKTKTIVSYQRGDRENETTDRAPVPVESSADADAEKKLMILYAMCSLEFIVILCFVALFMWKRYQDWKLLKEYDHQKRKQILEKIRNTTNRKLQESLY